MSLDVPSAQYKGLSTDPKPNDPDIQLGTTYLELDTHVTYFWTGSNWKTWDQLYKEGRYVGITTTAGTSGIYQGIIGSAGSFTRIFDATYGLHQKIDTGSTINICAGIRNVSSTAERGLNPYLRVVFALDQITDCDLFIGWSNWIGTLGNAGLGSTGSDMYPDHASMALVFPKDGADFLFYHNDGTSPGTTEVTPVGVADTGIHTIEIRAINSITKYQYKFDHALSWTDITTDIPGETIELGLQCWIKNRVASSKFFRLIDVYTRIDNKG
jgi:hypothetical protein